MIKTEIKNILLVFETDKAVFSPNSIDCGTLAMLSLIDFSENDKVLDLGCGYGVVGILSGKMIGGQNVFMCDISEIAVSLAKRNAELNDVPNIHTIISNGLDNITENDFTLILSNPPYHTDFSVAKHFIEDGFKKLKLGGRMVMVTKRLEWYKNKLSSVFGGVKVQEVSGYYVFVAEKRCAYIKRKVKRNKLSRKLQRRKRKNK